MPQYDAVPNDVSFSVKIPGFYNTSIITNIIVVLIVISAYKDAKHLIRCILRAT